MSIISVAASKGGIGKTFISVNLACALSTEGGKKKEKREKILIIDFDASDRVFGHFFQNKPENKKTIYDFLTTDIPISDVIVETEYGIDIIMSDSRLDTLEANIESQENHSILLDHFRVHLDEVSKYKHIIIDNHPSKGALTKTALRASDYVLIPTQFEKDSIETLYIIVNEIMSIKAIHPDLKIAGILPSMVQLYRPNQQNWQNTLLGVPDYKQLLIPINIELAEAVRQASTLSRPFYFYKPKHNISQAFNKLTEVFK